MEYRNKKARYLFLAGIVFLCMFLNLKANAAASMVGVPVVTGNASGAKVTLTWNKVPNARGYNILMYRENTKTYRYLTSVWTTGNVTWTYKCSTNGTFRFKVRAIRDYKGKRYYGENSKVIAIKTAINPGPRVTYGRWDTSGDSASIRIHWEQNKLADGYAVFRSTDPDTGYICLATLAGNDKLAYRDTRADEDLVYYYRVKAYRKNPGGRVYGALGESRKVVPAGVVQSGRKILFVGDSRVEFMKAYFKSDKRVTWYGKSGEGIMWLKSTASSYIAKKLDGGTDLFLWLGTNDPDYIQIYTSYYKTMVPKWKAAGAKVYIVSVGPENMKAFGKADTTADITAFNKKLRTCADSTGAVYVDLYSYLEKYKFVTIDGSHYDQATCTKIYNYLKAYFG